MKTRGRDVLIGVLLGAALIIWVTTRHNAHNSSSSHPRATASASASPSRAAKTPATKAPAPKAGAPATHKPTPAASAQPSPLTHASKHAASSKPADSGIGNGVIAIAALIAIAASLSTVALTVRHMRAGSMRGETH